MKINCDKWKHIYNIELGWQGEGESALLELISEHDVMRRQLANRYFCKLAYFKITPSNGNFHTFSHLHQVLFFLFFNLF